MSTITIRIQLTDGTGPRIYIFEIPELEAAMQDHNGQRFFFITASHRYPFWTARFQNGFLYLIGRARKPIW